MDVAVGRAGRGDAAHQPGAQGETLLVAEEEGGAGHAQFFATVDGSAAADRKAGVRLDLDVPEALEEGRIGPAQREGIPLGVAVQDFAAGEGLADLDPGGGSAGSRVLEPTQRFFRGDDNAGEVDGGTRASGQAEWPLDEGKASRRPGRDHGAEGATGSSTL